MPVKIEIVGQNKTKRAFKAVGRGLDKLKRKSIAVGRAMGRAFGGVARKLLNIKTLLAGGALTIGLARSIGAADKFAASMAQVHTLLDDGQSIKKFTLAVRDLSAETGFAADELSNGLYQALSAGVPPDNAIDFLATSSKAAAAGATDVASAVDVLTTVMNSFKMEASETTRVGDVLFQTVKLGKTTLGELAANLANVAPLAAASGVKFEEVAAAVATLTKQGVPTAQAVTQIRSAILSTNNVLGDGWAKTRSLQDAFAELAKRAGGSQVKLRAMVGRVEALNGVLGVTGRNAKGAAEDLASIEGAAGAMGKADAKVQKTRHWSKLFKSFKANVLAVGGAINKGLVPLVEKLADKFRTMAKNNGAMENLAAKIQKFAVAAANKVDAIFTKAASGIKTIAAVISALGKKEKRVEVFGAIAGLFAAALMDGATFAGNYLIAIAPTIGKIIGAAAKAAFVSVHDADKMAIKIIMKQQGVSKEEARLQLSMTKALILQKKVEKIETGRTAKALARLRKAVDEERKAVEKVFAAKNKPAPPERAAAASDIALADITSGKVDPNTFSQVDALVISVIDAATGAIVGSLASFQTRVEKEAAVRTAQHLQKFGDSSRRGLKKTLIAGGGESGLGFGGGAMSGGLTRLENKVPGSDIASTTRSGLDIGGLFDASQYGLKGGKAELGSTNNPMVVKQSEDVV